MSRIASGGADDSGIVDVDARTTTVDASTQIDRQHLPIVIDCIQHALADADYHDWQMPGSTVDYRNRTAPQRALLRIVDKWRRENASLLSTNAATLSLDANEIIITDFCNIINHPDLIDVAASSNLSSKWGRIVTMLAFAGVMAVRCVRADHVDVLRTLADRTADRLRDILSTSNTSNESWEDEFMTWTTLRDREATESQDNDWNTNVIACVIVITTAVLVTFGIWRYTNHKS